MRGSLQYHALVGRLHLARQIAATIISTMGDQADCVEAYDGDEIRQYVLDDVESTIYKVDKHLRPLLVDIRNSLRGRKEGRNDMSSRWKSKGIADIAEYIESEDAIWWLYGWTDGMGLSTDASEPEGDNASDENVLAYREGKAAGERERDKVVESIRSEEAPTGEG